MAEKIIGMAQISLTDVNDAYIDIEEPSDPHVGMLWLDQSIDPAMLKRWNGSSWDDLGELDPDLSETITVINETLGSMANDNKLDFKERQIIKDKLIDITGMVISSDQTNLPSASSLDNSRKGSFYTVRESAVNAGVKPDNKYYIAVETEYSNLRTYLQGMSPRPWNTSHYDRDKVINVVKDDFRSRWLNYYISVEELSTETAKQLKQNVDDIEIGGRNLLIDSKELKNVGSVASGLSRRINEEGHLEITAEEGNNNYLSGLGIILSDTNDLADGDIVTVSIKMKSKNATGLPDLYLGSQMGYEQLEGKITEHFSTIQHTRIWDSTNWSPHMGFRGRSGVYVFKEIKLEKGNKATDWTPAPEDTEEKIEDLVGKMIDVEFELGADQIVSKVTGSEKYISDLDSKASGATVSALTDRITTAENKITDTSIINTVTGSTQWGNLATRLNNAETKITDSSIISTVRSSSEYLGDLTNVESKFGNLVKNPELTGGLEGWSNGEELTTIVTTTSPFNGSRVLRNYTAENTITHSEWFEIDPSKAYEITMWVRKNAVRGRWYVGVHGNDTIDGTSNNIGFVRVSNNTGEIVDEDYNNFYFESSNNNTSTEWTKIKGYLMPTGTNHESMIGIGSGSFNAIMKPNLKRIRLRWLNYENGGTATYMYVAMPKVVEVSNDYVTSLTSIYSEMQASFLLTSTAINGKVSGTDFNGNNIMSMFNQTATTIKLLASKIEFDGHVFGEDATFRGIVEGGILRSSDRPSWSDPNNINRAEIISGVMKFESNDVNIWGNAKMEFQGWGVTSEGSLKGLPATSYPNEYKTSVTRRHNFSVLGIDTYGGTFGILSPRIYLGNGTGSNRGVEIISSGYNPPELRAYGSSDKINFSQGFILNSASGVNNNIEFSDGTMISVQSGNFCIYGDRTDGHSLLVRSHVRKSSYRNDFYINDNGYMYTPPTFDNTTTNSPTLRVGTSAGMVTSTVSARKYKLNIKSVKDPYRILDLEARTWHDKGDVERYAQALSLKAQGKEYNFDDVEYIKRIGGLIAEEVVDAGLDIYADFNENGEVTGVAYDRIWTLLIPITRDHEDKINEVQTSLFLLRVEHRNLQDKFRELEDKYNEMNEKMEQLMAG